VGVGPCAHARFSIVYCQCHTLMSKNRPRIGGGNISSVPTKV
jgi:hypothetical protein